GTEPASWLMAAGWIGMLFILRNRSNPAGLLCVGSLAGAVALTVHLCGAGGIEMPAIVETLLVLLLLGRCLLVDRLEGFAENPFSVGRPGEDSTRAAHLASEGGSRNPNDGRNEKRGWLIAGTVGCFVLAVLCWSMAAGPEWQRRIETVLGDAELMQTGRVDVAEQHYRRAAVLDPLSPEPVVRLAELAFRRWQSAPDLNEHRFDEAVELQELAIRQDPVGPGGYRRLGEYWLARARHSGLTEHADASVRAYQEAIERYPAYALLRADYAVALAAAGEERAARKEATEALRLNEINRQEGHTDKLLDTERLNALESLPDGAVLP
ncbi:MAG: hypothetical protein KDA79_22765, partial [Planctomycetaceae bacterium]|nr:hypothetical protein [Planctomycetaceae bacterium]